jgi:hypothetical protein
MTIGNSRDDSVMGHRTEMQEYLQLDIKDIGDGSSGGRTNPGFRWLEMQRLPRLIRRKAQMMSA